MPALRRRWNALEPILRLVGFSLVGLACLGPLLVLLYGALAALPQHPDWLLLALPTGRRAGLLVNSLELAGGSALAGMTVGFLAALALWRMPGRAARLLRGMALIFLPLPPSIHALAWMAAAQGLNTLLASLGMPEIRLMGWAATLWVQFMALLPLAVGICLVGLHTLDPDALEAGEMLAPGLQVLGQVILPLAAPMLAAGTGFLFLLTLVDHSVPGLFGVNTYALDIYAEFSASSQPGRALLLALPCLVIGFIVLAGMQKGIRRVTQPVVWARKPALQMKLPAWLEILVNLGLGMVTLQVVVPFLTLAGSTGGAVRLWASIWAARSEIRNTFWIATAAALLCVVMGWLAARWLACTRQEPGKAGGAPAAWLVVTAPLAVPAPLIGVALIAWFNRPAFGPAYGSILMPMLAAAARFLPFAAILLAAQFRRVDPLLLDAARLHNTHPLRTFFRIRLPLAAPGLLAAGVVVFALTLGELGATLLVIPPGQSTLTLRLYNYLHYGASEEVAGLSLLLTVLLVAAFGLGALALSLWGRLQEAQS